MIYAGMSIEEGYLLLLGLPGCHTKSQDNNTLDSEIIPLKHRDPTLAPARSSTYSPIQCHNPHFLFFFFRFGTGSHLRTLSWEFLIAVELCFVSCWELKWQANPGVTLDELTRYLVGYGWVLRSSSRRFYEDLRDVERSEPPTQCGTELGLPREKEATSGAVLEEDSMIERRRDWTCCPCSWRAWIRR